MLSSIHDLVHVCNLCTKLISIRSKLNKKVELFLTRLKHFGVLLKETKTKLCLSDCRRGGLSDAVGLYNVCAEQAKPTERQNRENKITEFNRILKHLFQIIETVTNTHSTYMYFFHNQSGILRQKHKSEIDRYCTY